MDIITLALAMANVGGGVDESTLTSMISEEIAKVVDGAPASFDTLKEISDWIEEHQDEYTDLLGTVSNLRVATVEETLEYLSDHGVILQSAEEEGF